MPGSVDWSVINFSVEIKRDRKEKEIFFIQFNFWCVLYSYYYVLYITMFASNYNPFYFSSSSSFLLAASVTWASLQRCHHFHTMALWGVRSWSSFWLSEQGLTSFGFVVAHSGLEILIQYNLSTLNSYSDIPAGVQSWLHHCYFAQVLLSSGLK